MTIWKFPLAFSEMETTVEMPVGASIVHFGKQGRDVCVWAAVDPQAPTEKRTFAVVGTGTPYDETTHTFIGTFTTYNGEYVWHVFEVKR